MAPLQAPGKKLPLSYPRAALILATIGIGLLTACSNTVSPQALPASDAISAAPTSAAPTPTTEAPPTADAPVSTNAEAVGPPPPPPPAPVAPPAPPAPQTTAPPAPKPPAPAPTSAPNVYYKSCKEAKAAGATPLHKGQPGYRVGLDGDNDGVACEK